MTLADEILAALPQMLAEHLRGPMVADVAAHLACGVQHARAALVGLDKDGRALFVRYPGSKAHHLVPLGHDFGRGLAVCANCRLVFEQPTKRKRINCGRSCASAARWKDPEHERVRATINAKRRTPEARARQTEINNRRWADPAERERLAARNRKQWADPATRAKLSAAIQRVNGSPEKRKQFSEIRKALWADPDYRARAIAATTAGKNTPEYKALFREFMKARWRDPEMRAKYTAANRARNAKRSEAAKQAAAK